MPTAITTTNNTATTVHNKYFRTDLPENVEDPAIFDNICYTSGDAKIYKIPLILVNSKLRKTQNKFLYIHIGQAFEEKRLPYYFANG